LGECWKNKEASIYMQLGQCTVTPYRDHKTLRPIFGGLLFLRIFSDKVVALERPCHLPRTLARHAANQPITSYDVGLSKGYP